MIEPGTKSPGQNQESLMRKFQIAAGTALLALSIALPNLALANPGGGGGGGGGSSQSDVDIPSMSQVSADIKAKRWQSAITKLKLIIADNGRNADAYNLLGYAYRNLGDYKRAGQYYVRALKIDPNHTGALEYQGILFIKTGDIDAAKANLAKLKALCGTDCENYEDLAKAINS
jgi:tetratricopeptide (TPR) repeat protein